MQAQKDVLARELSRKDITLAAVQESRLAKQGDIHIGQGYRLLYSGGENAGQKGVGIAKSSLTKRGAERSRHQAVRYSLPGNQRFVRDVSRFGDEMCAQDFDRAVAAKYHQLPAEPREQNLEAEWGELRTALTSAAEEHLGPRPKGIQSDLQSSETADVVECRRKAFTEANSRLSKKQTDVAQHNSKVNLVYKSDTDRLWSERACEVEKASADGNTQQQYALIRHHTQSGVIPIPEEKWKEHYSKLYDHQPEPFIWRALHWILHLKI